MEKTQSSGLTSQLLCNLAFIVALMRNDTHFCMHGKKTALSTLIKISSHRKKNLVARNLGIPALQTVQLFKAHNCRNVGYINTRATLLMFSVTNISFCNT
jgi:hypothetical protein